MIATDNTSLTSTHPTKPAPNSDRGRANKLSVDPWQANGWLREEERGLDGKRIPSLTIFLTGAECPFKCIFCDLWRQTLDGPTPPGAIPHQLTNGLKKLGKPLPPGIKLYNASNFFDPVAVPPEDDPEIADLLRSFTKVTVESHPRFINKRCFEFADRLHGSLEVAIGLETADPDILSRLNKQMTLALIEDRATELRAANIDIRIFLLVPPPYVSLNGVAASIRRSVTYATELGATHISLIPTRTRYMHATNLQEATEVDKPCLSIIEEVFDQCLVTADAVVSVDLWDIKELATCSTCGPSRIDRLRTMNLTGHQVTRIHCPACMS